MVKSKSKPAQYTQLGTDEPDSQAEAADTANSDTDPKTRPPAWGQIIPDVSFWSMMVFGWVTPLVLLGKRRQLNLGDMPPLEAGSIHS